MGSTLVEVDSKKEKLRQKEGWYHWIVTQQEDEDSAHLTSGGQEFGLLDAGDGPLLSAAPSETSDGIMVCS